MKERVCSDSVVVIRLSAVNSRGYSDLFESRLEKATQLGADHVIKIERNQTPQDVAKEVEKLLGGMPDRTIECTGAESAIQTGIYVSTTLFIISIFKNFFYPLQSNSLLNTIFFKLQSFFSAVFFYGNFFRAPTSFFMG